MKNTTFLLAAIICGVVAGAGMLFYLSAERAKLTAGRKLVRVVVATRDILKGEQVDPTMVKVSREGIPQAYVQPGALYNIEEAINKFTVAPMKKGEQVVGTKLLDVDVTDELAGKLPPGRRAVTIAINKVTGISDMIREGNRVDILITYYRPNLGEKGPRGAAEEALQVESRVWRENVPVLAVGEQIVHLIEVGGKATYRKMSKPNGTITVGLPPEDAVQLAILQSKAELSLLLRSAWETQKPSSMEGKKLSLLEVLGYRAVMSPGEVEIRRGTSELLGPAGPAIEEIQRKLAPSVPAR